MQELLDIINGSLLGDGCIKSDKEKYFTFQYTAKDKNFLENLKEKLGRFGIKCWITVDNPGIFKLAFYINTCPYKEFMNLRKEWYTKQNGKTQKILPDELELTPTTLFYWYIGDGCLVRRKNDENRVPTICLATNCFDEKDLQFLLQKLKEQNLNFYANKCGSGFNEDKDGGYALYSNVEDGTPLRFFQTIGLECPRQISNCSTGRKGIDHRERFFCDKWPTEDDWIKILSNEKRIGKFLREKRFEMKLTQKQMGNKIGMRRENIRDVELKKRNFCVKNFRKVLSATGISTDYLLEKLN
ncbi:MAG: hypothetical protein HY051_01950 [Candidatus Aenigmarchaeota archaeon]|nr:hypothetical protein [Candidatus Aenigmarchaeota archaeon]